MDGLKPYTEYKARISAENRLGRGKHSKLLRFRTLGSRPNAAPLNVEVKAPADDDSQSLLVTWRDPSLEYWNGPLVAYKIGWRKSEHKEDFRNWTEVTRHDASDLQARLTQLEPFTQYGVTVMAVNDFGTGPGADAVARTRETTPSVAPPELVCNHGGVHRGLTLSWRSLSETELRGRLAQYLVYFQHVSTSRTSLPEIGDESE